MGGLVRVSIVREAIGGKLEIDAIPVMNVGTFEHMIKGTTNGLNKRGSESVFIIWGRDGGCSWSNRTLKTLSNPRG